MQQELRPELWDPPQTILLQALIESLLPTPLGESLYGSKQNLPAGAEASLLPKIPWKCCRGGIPRAAQGQDSELEVRRFCFKGPLRVWGLGFRVEGHECEF